MNLESFVRENSSVTSTPSNTGSAGNQSQFFPDFGLSALSSLTQIAKMSHQVKENQIQPNGSGSVNSSPQSVAQSLTNQNLASLGSLSLEAFKSQQVSFLSFLMSCRKFFCSLRIFNFLINPTTNF